MSWRLLVLSGADAGEVLPLPNNGSATLGNNRKLADLFLHDLHISPQHCLFEVIEDQVIAKDLDRSTGTFVHGKPIKETRLGAWDVLRLGNTFLRLEETVDDRAVLPPQFIHSCSNEVPKLPWKNLPELAGQLLGHYAIASPLGRGHYGVSFRAWDLNTEKWVTLKVLSPEFPANDAELQHFAKVMKTRLSLHAPNCEELYGVGKTSHYCWMALEYIECESMAARMRRIGTGYKPSWQPALQLGLDCARALCYLHDRRVIFGNLTPENILISLSDQSYHLTDLLMDQAVEGSQLQANHTDRRTDAELPYFSPEQTEENAFIDHLSDLYNLGAVIYAKATGVPPFQGSNGEETMDLIRAGHPDHLTKHDDTIPEGLDRLVMRLLAHNQEDRYQSAHEVLDDLQTVASKFEFAFSR